LISFSVMEFDAISSHLYNIYTYSKYPMFVEIKFPYVFSLVI
jgi:hypothetical protein